VRRERRRCTCAAVHLLPLGKQRRCNRVASHLLIATGPNGRSYPPLLTQIILRSIQHRQDSAHRPRKPYRATASNFVEHRLHVPGYEQR
jgi:hypothetical protein